MKEGGSLWGCEDRGRSMGSEDMNLVSSQRIETALNSQRVYQADHLQYRCAPAVVNSRRGDSGRKARPAGVSGFVEPGGKLYANDRERYLAPQRDFRSGIYSADDGRQDNIVVEPDSRRGTVNMNMNMSSGGLQMRGMLGRNTGGRADQQDWGERVGVMGGDGSAGEQSDVSDDEDDEDDDGDGEMEGEVERMQDSMVTNDNGGNNNNGSNNNGNIVHGSLEGFQKSNLDRESSIPKTGLQNHHTSLNMFLSPPFLNSFPSPSGAPALMDATSAAQNGGGGGGAGGVATSSGFYRDGLVKEPPALARENNNSSATANTASLHEHHQARIPPGLHHEGPLPGASVSDADNYYTQLLQSTGSLAQKDAGVEEGGAFGERKGTTASTESSEPSLRIILSDPLTGALMDDATILTCGHSFGSSGLQHVLEARACITCGQPVTNDSIAPNHALRAVVQAFRREEEFQSLSSKSAKRRRDKFEQVLEKTGYSDPMSMDCSRGKGVQFPFVVGDRVVIKGNKRTPERFVGREAVITTQCLNGWYVVKTLDNAESVKLQYRSLMKVGDHQSSNELSQKASAPSWL